jgi:hypothetical protein
MNKARIEKKMNFYYLLLAGFAICLMPTSIRAQNVSYPDPDTFVGKESAPPPKNLPDKFIIPTFTQINIDVFPGPEDFNQPPPRLLSPEQESHRLDFNPNLKSVEILRDASDIQVIYTWEGDKKSYAYQINGVTAWLCNLRNPNAIICAADPTALEFSLNHQGVDKGSSGEFPSLFWYKSSFYSGKATIDSNDVLVFYQNLDEHQKKLYVDAKTLLPVIYDSRFAIFKFNYLKVPNAKVTPPDNFAKAIKDFAAELKIRTQG